MRHKFCGLRALLEHGRARFFSDSDACGFQEHARITSIEVQV